MLEKAFRGGGKYWTLVMGLVGAITFGVFAYLIQLDEGLSVTGLSRDVPWGFYIAQFTFLVGVAASAVMVVLPYYLHNFKAFGKVTILGEFLAISAVCMCMLFIFVDMGQPQRVLNVMLHPTPNSMMFWDMMALMGYFFLNALIARVTFGAERKGIAPPKWIKPVIILSIPWAVSIHTVTAFLYSGLGARPFWLTAILAPRFLASAFAAGPALLILLCLVVRKFTKFDPGELAIRTLAKIVAYAMIANVFFVSVEMFTVFYSDMPHHTHHFQFLFSGYDGADNLVPWMWTSMILSVLAVFMLVIPKVRNNFKSLAVICGMVIFALWIDKGMGLISAGFVPTPFEKGVDYWPTIIEGLVGIGVYGIGFLILTLLFKIGISVREEHIKDGT